MSDKIDLNQITFLFVKMKNVFERRGIKYDYGIFSRAAENLNIDQYKTLLAIYYQKDYDKFIDQIVKLLAGKG